MFSAVEFDTTAKERIRRVAELERRKRIGAFVGIQSRAAGMVLHQMTARIALRLEFADNQFVTGRQPDESDIAHALLELSPDAQKASPRRLKRLIRRVAKEPRFVEQIADHIRGGFEDLPQTGSNNADNLGTPQNWFAAVCDRLCSDYGWTVDQAMDTPLAAIWQLLSASNKRKLGRKYMTSNPLTQQAKANEMKRLQMGAVSNG